MGSVVVASAEYRLAARRFEVERWVAAVAVLLCFANFPFMVGRLTINVVLVLALAPVWLGSLPRFKGASALIWCTVFALACGATMALFATPDRSTFFVAALDFAVVTLTLVGRVGVLLWARTRLSAPVVAIVAGVAIVATLSRTSALFSSNPWKFGFAVPVAVLTLAIAWRINRRWLEIATLLALALMSATNDARSSSAILGLTVLVVGWQSVRSRESGAEGQSRWAGTALVVAAFGWVAYHVVQWAILSGQLGESTQRRTQAQLDESGSLLLGGRPEIGASVALFRDTPWGFGLGVQPSLQDVLVAKSGMASINYDPNNGYVENYMFGDGFSLHSVIGDLWANLGLGGLVMCAVLVYVAFRAVLIRVRVSRASALVVFLACNAAWALPFGPLRSSATVLALLVGLALIPANPRVPDDAWDQSLDAPRDG